MNSKREDLIFLFIGPILGVAIASLAFLGGGPGFFFFTLAGGALFLIGTPMTQALLLLNKKYKGRYRTTCGYSMGAMFALLIIAASSGIFNIC
ncbi:MAG: hypothetical protein U1F46_17585 [Marinagarivorans sp.]